MVVHQCFATKFRHAASITRTNRDHGPLSDKSDPPSQFAGYGPVFDRSRAPSNRRRCSKVMLARDHKAILGRLISSEISCPDSDKVTYTL